MEKSINLNRKKYQKLLTKLGKVSDLEILEDLQQIDFKGVLPDLSTGTPFQKKVWQQLRKIPKGETRSYLWVATEIGTPKAVRAVATAIGNNPQFYIVPCHRVIRSSGELGQFHWGKNMKKALQELEKNSN